MTARLKRPVSCGGCGHIFSEGEEAWAEDWKVCDAPNWRWRWETRYSCNPCNDKKQGCAA